MIDKDKLWRKSTTEGGKTKESFVLFYSTADAVRTAFQGDTCKLGIWFDAVLEYEMYGTKPTFADAPQEDVPILNAMFEITKSQLEINQSKWIERCEKQAERRRREAEKKKGSEEDSP